MAHELSLPDRERYWTSLASNMTQEMDLWMWDEEAGMHFDLFPNGTRTWLLWRLFRLYGTLVMMLFGLLLQVAARRSRPSLPSTRCS
jgi:hypothetical protein